MTKFTIQGENHTLGNIIRMKLVQRDDVTFAGYKMPHPLKEEVVVSLQTTASLEPVLVLSDAVDDLMRDVDQLLLELDSQK